MPLELLHAPCCMHGLLAPVRQLSLLAARCASLMATECAGSWTGGGSWSQAANCQTAAPAAHPPAAPACLRQQQRPPEMGVAASQSGDDRCRQLAGCSSCSRRRCCLPAACPPRWVPPAPWSCWFATEAEALLQERRPRRAVCLPVRSARASQGLRGAGPTWHGSALHCAASQSRQHHCWLLRPCCWLVHRLPNGCSAVKGWVNNCDWERTGITTLCQPSCRWRDVRPLSAAPAVAIKKLDSLTCRRPTPSALAGSHAAPVAPLSRSAAVQRPSPLGQSCSYQKFDRMQMEMCRIVCSG